jgi:hypothetical protein
MEKTTHKSKSRWAKWAQVVLIAAAVILILAGLVIGTKYAASPASIRQPELDHYHFRMQIVIDGEPLNFGDSKFQTPYEKGQCSAELSNEPLHFHDNKDQFVHIHWNGMTGGLVLKNYGWDFVSGFSSTLGYRFDNLPKIKKVPVHGHVLPEAPETAKFWVYTGDDNGYQKRSFNDFKDQDLEKFFGKPSNLNDQSGWLDWLFPKASAHGSEVHAEHETDEERLTRINNLVGNVVIFEQDDEPSEEKIKERFANLLPLSDSTCGG